MPRISPSLSAPLSPTFHRPTVSGELTFTENVTPGETIVLTYGRHRLTLTAVADGGSGSPLGPRQFRVGASVSQTVANLAFTMNNLKSARDLTPAERAVVRQLPPAVSNGMTVELANVEVSRGGRRLDVDVPASSAIDEPREGVVVFA